MKRRNFIQRAGTATLMTGVGTFPLSAFAKDDLVKLTVLHTNDVHSRIEPFPMDGSRNQGLGGAARRASLLKKIRSEEEHLLLLDAGDIFQGTPYFNMFGGEIEFKLMSAMKYDAATIGNHDFDGGIDGLHKQLEHANFPFLICNYDFSDTIMNQKTRPYQVFQKGPIKIGVFGVGIELKGLVPEVLYKKTKYLNPIESANKYAAILKNEEKCDYVICLSHLGYEYEGNNPSDVLLAKNSKHIDLIIGGQTHTLMQKPEEIANLLNKKVIINQVGYAGIALGRLDVFFDLKARKSCFSCGNKLIKA